MNFSTPELQRIFEKYAVSNGYSVVGTIPKQDYIDQPELVPQLKKAVREYAGVITNSGPSKDGSYVIVSEGWWHW